MLILSYLNDSELKKVYISGIIPFLRSILSKNQFWHSRTESMSGRRIDYSSEVDWMQTYHILRRELSRTNDTPRLWNEEDNSMVSRILYSMEYRIERCLDRAISEGSVNIFRFMITECEEVDINSISGAYNVPCILLAIRRYQVEILKILLADPRIDVRTENMNHFSLLSEVCIRGNRGSEEMLRILLADSRIDPTYNNSECISLASRNDNHSLVKILLEDGRADPREALIYAAGFCDSETISILLTDVRVNPSLRNNEALFQIVDAYAYDCIAILLADSRVNPNDRDGYILFTAVKGSTIHSEVSVLEELLEDKRIDASVQNNKALRIAIEEHNAAAMDVLLRRDEVIDLLDDSYLVLALETRDEEVIDIIRYMLE